MNNKETREQRSVASRLNERVGQLSDAVQYLEKGTRLADYWSNSNKEQRAQIKKEVAMWKKREKRLINFYKVLWVFMIIATIYICVKVV